MRILHCIPTMGAGGAERQLAYLCAELPALGWEVHVALVAGGPNLARLRESGATVHTLRARSNYDPALPWRLWRLVRRVRPDLVQAWLSQMEILAGLVATASRIPWVLTERSSALAYPDSVRSWVRPFLARRAGAVVANSAGGVRYWEPRLRPPMALTVIPNAVPLPEIDATPAAGPDHTGLDPAREVVLYVGRFSPEKNLDALIASLPLVLRRPRTVAVLCGDGPTRAAVQTSVIGLGLADRVRLVGFVPDPWVWMKRASVLVSPSLFEGHPNAVLEAAACGCPLVVSDIPAHREFLDPDSAVLVDTRDPTALADAILGVLADPEVAARRAKSARARVESWSPAEIARRYDRIYRQTLGPIGAGALV
jgi:glycosyltransferase involved in cell wall biosynthesis